MEPKHFTESDLTPDALKDAGTLLVDFWAPWCGPCRMIAPIIEQLAGEYEGRATVGKINVDDHQKAAVGFGVTSIPTLILFKDGEEQERITGARGKEALTDLLDKYC